MVPSLLVLHEFLHIDASCQVSKSNSNKSSLLSSTRRSINSWESQLKAPYLHDGLPHPLGKRKLSSCTQLFWPQLLLQCRQLLHHRPVLELQLLLPLTVLLKLRAGMAGGA